MTEDLPLYSSINKKNSKLLKYVVAERHKAHSGDAFLFEILCDPATQVPFVEIAKIIVELNQRKQRGELISLRTLLQEKINMPPQTLFDLPLNGALRAKFLELEREIEYNVESEVGRIDLFNQDVQTVAGYPRLEPLEREIIQALLSRFTLHVTALNNYLSCPLKFFFENLLKAPCEPSSAATFGSAIHAALEQFYLKMQQDPAQQFPGSDELVGFFSTFMHRHVDCFTPDNFAARLARGQETLKNYYLANFPYANKIVAIERNIGNVVVNGVPIKGKIDKLAFTGRDVEIIDYKTGDIEKAFKQLEPPNEHYPDGGNYWRQAVFYHILIDHLPNKSWHVTGVGFDFIEQHSQGLYQLVKVPVGPADIETVTRQIISVSKRIQSHDFYTGCGKQGCRWCEMLAE